MVTDSAHLKTPKPFTVVLNLEECRDLPIGEVGARTLEFVHLIDGTLRVPKTTVFSRSYLDHMLQETEFPETMMSEFARMDWNDTKSVEAVARALQETLHEIVLPENVLKDFSQMYLEHFGDKFVAIRPSLLTGGLSASHNSLSEMYVKGEANMLESFLKVLAKLYTPEKLLTRFEEWRYNQLAPTCILIQEMIEPLASGMMTLHPDGEKKHVITVAAVWGVFPPVPDMKHIDTFEVDTRTWHITHRHVQVKPQQYVYQSDELKQVPVPSAQQIQPSVDDAAVIKIARAAHQLSQEYFTPQVIEWAVAGKGEQKGEIFLLNILPLPTEESVQGSEGNRYEDGFENAEKVNRASSRMQSTNFTKNAKTDTPTMTKVLVAVGDTSNAGSGEVVHVGDGVGLLRSEPIFLALGVHPQALLNQGKVHLIEENIVKSIQRAAHSYGDGLLLYRAQNFTSCELAFFPEGEKEEEPEHNPFLGYRGAIRTLHNFELFDVEVRAALRAARLLPTSTLGLILPFVRTSAEFALLKKHLAQKPPEAGQYFAQNLWIQCSTPENLLQIHQYLHHQPKGLIIDIASLHGLLHGVDPEDPDLFSQYPLDVPLLMRLLNHVKEQNLKTATQLHLLLPHFHKDLIEYAVNLGMDAITLKPQDVTRTKQTISELEQKRFTI